MAQDVYFVDDLEKLWRHVHHTAVKRKAFRDKGGKVRLDKKYLKRLASKLKKSKKPKKQRREQPKPDVDPIVFKFSQGNTLHRKRKAKEKI